MGFVADVVFTSDLYETRLQACFYCQDWKGLRCTLVNPTGGEVFLTGDADLDTRGVGKIDQVLAHTEALGEFLITAGPGLKVTPFGADKTEVTLRQFLEAGVAIPLAETLFGDALTVNAGDLARVAELNVRAYVGVEVNFLIVQA
tara:strand:+ start:2139 stop:2573 length:435 start_codon:yes stop_codon:yes gene_type:complete